MTVKIITISTLVFLLPVFAQAQYFEEKEQERKYETCITLAERDANKALEFAKNWYSIGGGAASLHCEGLALFELEKYRDAAEVFENAATQIQESRELGLIAEKNKDILVVQLHYFAGVAWHNADELVRSYNSLSEAVSGVNTENEFAYDIFVERGLVQFTLEDYDNAAEDFSDALEIDPNKIDAFLYRARSFRRLEKHLEARLDLNAALAISPDQAELLFESGINYRMQRDDEKALVEWEKLMKMYPDTHWHKLAQDNIDLIGQ